MNNPDLLLWDQKEQTSRTAFPMDPSASGSLDNFWNTFGKAFPGRELQAKLGKILLGKENL